MAKTPMTLRGAELLRAELHRLKSVERPANSQAIAEARAHGDLSENAEYDAARKSLRWDDTQSLRADLIHFSGGSAAFRVLPPG